MKREFEVKCKNCGKIFTVIEEETKFPIKGDKYFCCRSCANTRHHSEETKLKISEGVKNSEIFAKNNLTGICQKASKKIFNNLYKDPYIIKSEIKNNKVIHYYKCIVCNKIFTNISERDCTSKKYCSLNCRHIELSKRRGGYRIGSGHSKHGSYKGIRCDSTWELAFLIYHIEHNLYIERCKEKRTYFWKNENHIYYPDFITSEGIIEIKGYITEQSIEKSKQNPDIKIISKNEIMLYINYVVDKYGKDFYKLFD